MKDWVEDPKSLNKWLALGRTALIPKTLMLNMVEEFRPITCLNTIYKIFTGLLGQYVKEHVMTNDIWDEQQMGARDGVLGAVDQLLIDQCIMGEVQEHQRNLTVCYYDYKKAYDLVHHD